MSCWINLSNGIDNLPTVCFRVLLLFESLILAVAFFGAEGKTDVTAAACKSLSLTQALAARCQDIDVSDSSEEDMNGSVSGFNRVSL